MPSPAAKARSARRLPSSLRATGQEPTGYIELRLGPKPRQGQRRLPRSPRPLQALHLVRGHPQSHRRRQEDNPIGTTTTTATDAGRTGPNGTSGTAGVGVDAVYNGTCTNQPLRTGIHPAISLCMTPAHQFWTEAGKTYTALPTHQTGSHPNARRSSMAASIAPHANVGTLQRRGLTSVGTILCIMLIGRYKHRSGVSIHRRGEKLQCGKTGGWLASQTQDCTTDSQPYLGSASRVQVAKQQRHGWSMPQRCPRSSVFSE